MRVDAQMSTGESAELQPSIKIGSRHSAGRWTARLRHAGTPSEIFEQADWTGDPILLTGKRGELFEVVLDRGAGDFAAGQADECKLIVRRVSTEAGAVGRSQVDFFVDLKVDFSNNEAGLTERISVPIRLTAKESSSDDALLIAGGLGTAVMAGIWLVLKR
jgi:hypothetical protein